MNLNLKNIVGDIFHTDEKAKAEEEKKTSELMQKMANSYGVKQGTASNQYNPFLKKNGEIFNPYINYQKLLDSSHISSKAKEYITQATGLKPTKISSTPSNSSGNYTSYKKQNANGFKLGLISAKYEAGGYNGGMVSSGAGDYGGISYGIPQFSTTTGSAAEFVNWLKQSHPEIGGYFGNYKPGTTEFSNAWKKAYADYGDTFSDIQTSYAYDKFASPLAKLAMEKTGIDYTRSPALQELVYTTALQFGGGTLGLSALGNVNANMSDADIINASFDKKIANYKSYFRSSSASVQEAAKNRFTNERNDILGLLGYSNGGNSGNTIQKTTTPSGGGNYASSVGKRITDTSKFNNNAAKGQCVWYVRGRAKEKLGKEPGAIGNANEMYYGAKESARLAPTIENLKGDTILSYKYGTSSAGKKYGHVIYIEDVVGDTVYYTEGGSGYYKNGTDGVVKTATRQQILNGVNSSGARIGSDAIGLIDLSKY